MDDHPHLTLVDNATHTAHDEEFLPLPFYPWDERPNSLPLDPDEVATAIHIAKGDVFRASELLKSPEFRVNRLIKASPRLTRILLEHIDLQVTRAASEYIRALDSPSDRRREWASSRIMASRAAASHPFAPAPPQPSAQAASLSLSQTAAGARTLTFRWRTDADDVPLIDGNDD